MIEVVAPTTLPENYTFPAAVGNRMFMAKVPRGGVEAGQRFSVPLPQKEDFVPLQVQIPVGHWRDGFWQLFSLGFFHPTVWNSCCCIPSEFSTDGKYRLIAMICQLCPRCRFVRSCCRSNDIKITAFLERKACEIDS